MPGRPFGSQPPIAELRCFAFPRHSRGIAVERFHRVLITSIRRILLASNGVRDYSLLQVSWE